MNSKVESTRSPVVDSMLLMISVAMLIGGIWAYYFYQELAITPVRVAGLIGVTLVAAWVAAQSTQGAALFRFFKEADIERRKVVWPTHQETLQTSLMVIVVTIIISLFLAGVDWLLGALVRSLLGGG
ncbi:MAG: preprotein translocase subunit SecE [Xanthomonadales bacterium]|jgi:preprotein translocase subunit SecE|nr:preprotein translocase subunit SecE [Xanthomonadales bacterium]